MSGVTTSQATPVASAPDLLRVAVVASVAAGLIHYAVVPEHRQEWWAAGLFFTLLGAFEIVWAAVAWFDDRSPVLWLGILANVATLVVWTVSRTAGLPFGPEAGEPEAVGALDVVCDLAELAVVIVLLLALGLRRNRPAAA
ncbi:hypothetical protein ACIPSA_03095 [Streptomyces sp. NPDC086549]|uniref:hypothetical protein n=1 Tax=Streptomyces sp. NPDC086549 TaxID=3365752 RepID=UPI00382A9CB5